MTAYFSTLNIFDFNETTPQAAVGENQQIDFMLEYRPNDPSQPRPSIEFSYNIGPMGSIYMSNSEGEITDKPGNTFNVTIYRETFIKSEYSVIKKKLIETDTCDFPFEVTFSIQESGINFSDYFIIQSGPQETGEDRGMYIIKRNNTELTKTVHVQTKAKMVNSDLFPWITPKTMN